MTTTVEAPKETPSARAAASEWLWVAALYLVAVVVYVLLAKAQPVPLVTPDEYTYGGAARSLANGDGLSVLGESADLKAALYVYLIAPAWWLASGVGAYTFAKAIGAAALCLTIVPVWWLTRQFTSRWIALVPAVLIVIGSWMTSAGSLLTENLALPLAAAALTAGVMALRRPDGAWIWWAFGLSVLATWARMQMGVLFGVLVLALLLDALLLQPRADWRARLERHRTPLIVLVGVMAVGAILVLVAGRSTLGFYDTVTNYSPSLGAIIKQIGRQWLALTVMTAIVPMALAVGAAASPAAWRDEDRLRPLLAVGLSAVVVFILQSAWFNAGVGAPHAIQRYVVYAAPLLLVLAVVVADTRVVPLRTAAIAGTVVALLGFAAPAVGKVIEERGLYGLWLRFGDTLGASAGVAVGVVGLVAVGIALALLARTRPNTAALGIGAVIAVVLLVQSQAGWKWQLDLARAFRAQYPSLTWLDADTKPGVSRIFGFGNSPLSDNVGFFNEHLAQTLIPKGQYVGNGARGKTCVWTIDPDGSVKIAKPCDPAPRQIWNNDPILRLAFANGRLVADRPLLGQVFDMQGPPKAQAGVVLPCSPPTLSISADGRTFHPPRPSEVTCTGALQVNSWLTSRGALVVRMRGGRDDHRVQVNGRVVPVPAGKSTTVRLPLDAGPSQNAIGMDWDSSDGAPTIESVTLVADGRSTPML